MVMRESSGGDRFETLLYCDKYEPYRRHGGKNPNFNAYGGLLLDLKDNKPSAVEWFRDYLEKLLDTDFPIVTVPSHDPAKTSSGLTILAQKLAANGRIDATSCLVRTKNIDKLAHGGDRSIEVHLASIVVANIHLIQGKDVLLLDDVSTSGNSLEACRQLLTKAGAANVQKLALGLTVKGT